MSGGTSRDSCGEVKRGMRVLTIVDEWDAYGDYVQGIEGEIEEDGNKV